MGAHKQTAQIPLGLVQNRRFERLQQGTKLVWFYVLCERNWWGHFAKASVPREALAELQKAGFVRALAGKFGKWGINDWDAHAPRNELRDRDRYQRARVGRVHGHGAQSSEGVTDMSGAQGGDETTDELTDLEWSYPDWEADEIPHGNPHNPPEFLTTEGIPHGNPEALATSAEIPHGNPGKREDSLTNAGIPQRNPLAVTEPPPNALPEPTETTQVSDALHARARPGGVTNNNNKTNVASHNAQDARSSEAPLLKSKKGGKRRLNADKNPNAQPGITPTTPVKSDHEFQGTTPDNTAASADQNDQARQPKQRRWSTRGHAPKPQDHVQIQRRLAETQDPEMGDLVLPARAIGLIKAWEDALDAKWPHDSRSDGCYRHDLKALIARYGVAVFGVAVANHLRSREVFWRRKPVYFLELRCAWAQDALAANKRPGAERYPQAYASA